MGNYRLLGDRHPFTPNEPNAMTIAYYLKEGSAAATPPASRGGPRCVADGGDGKQPFLTISDAEGKTVCTLIVPSRTGVNQVVWPLTVYAPQPATGGGRGGRGPGFGGPPAPEGEYTFTLHVGGRTHTRKARLISRPK